MSAPTLHPSPTETLVRSLTDRLWADARDVGVRRDPLWPARLRKQRQWAGLAVQAGCYRAFLDAVHAGRERQVKDEVCHRLERLIADELGMAVVVHGPVRCRACGGRGEVDVVKPRYHGHEPLELEGTALCGDEHCLDGWLACGICGESEAVLRLGDDEVCEGCRREVCEIRPPVVDLVRAPVPPSSPAPSVVDAVTPGQTG